MGATHYVCCLFCFVFQKQWLELKPSSVASFLRAETKNFIASLTLLFYKEKAVVCICWVLLKADYNQQTTEPRSTAL